MQQQYTPSSNAQAVPFTVLGMIGTARLCKTLYTAVHLGIPDLLQQGPKRVAELAAATSTHENSLYRILRALASAEVFEEQEGETFALTEISSQLCTSHPASLRDIILWLLSDGLWAALGDIEYSVRTGQPAFEHIHGMDVWSYLQRHPDVDAAFNGTVTSVTHFVHVPIERLYDFSSVHVVADIGGGNGSLLADILYAYPHTEGILLERESVIEEAKTLLAQKQLAQRCHFIIGDAQEAIPSGADIYIMKHFLHGRDDQMSIDMLKKCRYSMSAGQKVLLIEQVLPNMKASLSQTTMDLHMLLVSSGRERTQSEYQQLLESSGFTLTRVLSSYTPDSIIEGEAV